jgi:hypothetical protein
VIPPTVNCPLFRIDQILPHQLDLRFRHGNAARDVPPQFAEWGLALVALLFPRGAVDEPQHLANRDRFRKPCEIVTAARAAVRLHESALFQRFSDDKIDFRNFWGVVN